MDNKHKAPIPPHIPGKVYPLIGIFRLVTDPPGFTSRLYVNWLSKVDEPVYHIEGAYERYKKYGYMPLVFSQEWVDRIEEFSDGWQSRISTFVPYNLEDCDD